ncbi:hypothetical protein LMG11579_1084 [Bifidobacterium adolescentis]|nr:hypothetical protein LMG11579_1084 [Bifidobacterium adolescentis]
MLKKLLMKLQVLAKKILRRKKRSCIKCKIELASDNKLPFCSACWEEITGYVKTAGIALGTLMVALIRKYGPKVGKAAFMTLKAILKK